MKHFCCALLFLGIASVMYGQGNSTVFVKKITINGLQKCKERMVTRQLDFGVGDSLLVDGLQQRMAMNEQYLLGTRMFANVKMNIGDWANDSLEMVIDVEESWYIYPFPYIDYADRNFNAWWVEQNRALNRLNYSLRLYHENLTGNADMLSLITQVGYEQRFEVGYRFPFLGKKQRFGLETEVHYSRQRETGYATIRDSLNFFRSDDDYALRRFNVEGSLIYQPGLFKKQTVRLAFARQKIADTIATLNPDFLLNGRTRQGYFSLAYEYEIDRRDFRTYALNGWRLLAWVQKDGLGLAGNVNNLFADVAFANYHTFEEKWSVELLARARKTFFRKNLPYYRLRRAIGYNENYIRGYEYYTVDGQDYMYSKNSLRYAAYDREIDMAQYVPIRNMKMMPLKIYPKIHADFGYVVDRFEDSTSVLANQVLFGWGVGVDLVAYHKFVVQIEYSINHLWEKGLYLHFNLGF